MEQIIRNIPFYGKQIRSQNIFLEVKGIKTNKDDRILENKTSKCMIFEHFREKIILSYIVLNIGQYIIF